MGGANKKSGPSFLEKGLLIGGLVMIAAAVVLFHQPLQDLAWCTTRFIMDLEAARTYILSHQPYSNLIFIGLQILQVVLSPIPGELSCFLGGMIFGWAPGFFYSIIGLIIGSLINVSVGRLFERVYLERIIPKSTLNRFEHRIQRYGLVTVFILFLFPGAPKDIMCYLFGLSRIPIFAFLLVSSAARIPGTLVLNLQGAKVFEGDWIFFLVLTGAGLAVTVPALYFKNQIFQRLGFQDAQAQTRGHRDLS